MAILFDLVFACKKRVIIAHAPKISFLFLWSNEPPLFKKLQMMKYESKLHQCERHVKYSTNAYRINEIYEKYISVIDKMFSMS